VAKLYINGDMSFFEKVKGSMEVCNWVAEKA
jgi:hypothetical protein